MKEEEHRLKRWTKVILPTYRNTLVDDDLVPCLCYWTTFCSHRVIVVVVICPLIRRIDKLCPRNIVCLILRLFIIWFLCPVFFFLKIHNFKFYFSVNVFIMICPKRLLNHLHDQSRCIGFNIFIFNKIT